MRDGGPAFAHVVFYNEKPVAHEPGMSLRDYFAAHAPAAPESWRGGDRSAASRAAWAYACADALLAESVRP